jgi:hypothetical protein
MKHKNNSQNEIFFKNLASSYAEKSGNELKQDLANLNSSQSVDVFPLDTKVKSRIQSNKIKKWTSRLMPIVACFIILIVGLNVLRMPMLKFNNSLDSGSAENIVQDNQDAPSANLDFAFISNKLPSEYTLEKIDYDQQKTIYYIVSNKDTEVILTVEKFTDDINTEGLESININNKNAYGISNEDFSFIQYKKDNLLYILTSPNDYDDLIKISEYLI